MSHYNPFEDRIKTIGLITPNGRRWFRVSYEGKRGVVDVAVARTSLREARRILAQQDVLIGDGEPTRALERQIARNSDFAETAMLSDYGWQGEWFIAPDADLYGPQDEPDPLIRMPFLPDKCAGAGTLEGWQRDVALPLADQPLLVTALCISFAAPLRALFTGDLPQAFEIVGNHVDLAGRLVASVCGDPAPNGGYSVGMQRLASEPDAILAQHADMPLVVTGTDVFLASQSVRTLAAAFGATVCRTGNGQAAAPLLLATATQPFAMALGESALADLASTYQVTLVVDPTNRFGVFDTLPDGYADITTLTAALEVAMRKHHGTAIHEFLHQLVAERHADEAKLRRQVEKDVGQFHRRCKANRNDPAEVRTVNAFGLLYAGGRLAKHYGVLPQIAIGPNILKTYQQRRWRPAASQPIVERLRTIAARKDVLRINGRTATPTADAIKQAMLILKQTGRQDELWVRQKMIRTVLPDYQTLLAKPAVQALLAREGQRLVTKRAYAGVSDRFYCFLLPPEG